MSVQLIGVLLSVSLLFTAGCASNKDAGRKVATQSTDIEAPPIVGTLYTTVVFNKGKSTLNRESKENIRELASRAHHSREPIEKIRVLAWSDKEYPEKVNGQTSTKDIILASERAQKIKDFLEEDLKENEDIDAYNMARRPNLFSKLFRNDEFKVKEAFEESGATASSLPDGQVSFTKASKALVIIDYEGDEDNLP